MVILPAVTTIFNWREKIKEVKKLNLKEIALFLTCVNPKERHELFNLLEETKVKEIPFVHLRTDCTADEIDYLIKHYHAKAFNIHTQKEYPYFSDYKKYAGMTYIENTYEPLDAKELRNFAGICLDLGHLESSRIFRKEVYQSNIKTLKDFKIGCSHVAPVKDFSIFEKKEIKYSKKKHPHFMNNLSQLDYLKNYPRSYFGKYAALEMENSIKEQLEARDYICYNIQK